MSVHIGDAADTAVWRGRFAIRAAATGFPAPGTSFSTNPTSASRPTLSVQRTSLAREGSLFSSGALALSPCERILGFALNPLLDASGSAIGLLPLRNAKPSETTSGPAPLSLFSACEPDAAQRWVNGATDPWSPEGGGGDHDEEAVEGYDVCEIEGDISQQLSWIECPAGISPASIAWCGVPVGGPEDDDDEDGHNISSSDQQQQQLVLLGTTKSSIHIGSIPAELYEYLTSISSDEETPRTNSEGVSVPFELLGSLTTGSINSSISNAGSGGGGGGSVVSSLVPLRSATFDSPLSSMGGPLLVAGVCGDAVHVWDLCGDETPAYSLPAYHRNSSSSSSSLSPNSAYLHNSAYQPQSATAASWASAASPSGQVIAVGGSSGSVLLYDCRSGGCMVLDGYNNQVLRHHPGRLGSVSSIDFSPIVPWAVAVASQASSVAHVYDIRFPCAPMASLCASGGDRGFGGMGQLRHPQGGVSSLQWMPQRADLLCSSSSDGVVRVWTCRSSLSDTSQWENSTNNKNGGNNGSWEDEGEGEQEAAHYNGTSLQLVGSARVSTSQLAGSQSQWLASSTSFSSSAVVSTAISQSAPRGNLLYALSAEGTLASIEIPCSTLRHVAPESLLAADTERERRRHVDQQQGLGSTSTVNATSSAARSSSFSSSPNNAIAADPMFADEAATQRMIREERIVEGQLNERSLPETARGIIKCAQRRVARGHLMMALDICSLLQKAELLRPTTTTATNCGSVSKSAWTELGDVMWPGSRSPGDNTTTLLSHQQQPPSAFCIQRLIAYFSVKALSKASKTPSRITRIEVMTRAYMAQQRLLVRELAALSERIPATIKVCEWAAGAILSSPSSTPPPAAGEGEDGSRGGGVPALGNLPPSVGLPHREMLARVSALRLNIRIGMHVRANTLLSTLLKPHSIAMATPAANTSPIALAAMRVIEDALRCRPDFVEEATVCEIVRAMKNAAISEVYSSARTRFSTSNTTSKSSNTALSSVPPPVTFDDVYAFIVMVVEELLGWKPDAYTQAGGDDGGGGGGAGNDNDDDDSDDGDGEGFGVERVPALNSIQFSSTAARSRFGDAVAPASQTRRSTTKTSEPKGSVGDGDEEDEGAEQSDSLDDMMNDLDDDGDDHSDEPEAAGATTVMSPTTLVTTTTSAQKGHKRSKAIKGKGRRHTAPSDTLTPSQISKIRTKASNLAKAVVLAALEPLLSDNTSISTGKLRRLHRSFLSGFSGGRGVGGAAISVDSDSVRTILSSIKSQLRVAQSYHELRGLQIGLREAIDNHKDRSVKSVVPTTATSATENRQVSLYRQRLKMVSSNIITLVTKYQRSSLEEHQAFSRRGDGGGGDQRVGVFGWLGETPVCTYLKALLTQNQHVPFFWSCQQFLDAHRRFLPRKRASSSNDVESGDGRAHMFNYTTKAHFSKGLRKLAAKTKSVGAASAGVVKDVPVLCHQVESMALQEILRLDAAADAVVTTVTSIVGTSAPSAAAASRSGRGGNGSSASKSQLSSIIPTSREEKLDRVTGVLVREVHPYILTVSSIIGEIKTVGMHSGALEMPPLIERTLEVLSDIVMRVCGSWSQIVELAEGILSALKESGGLPTMAKPSLINKKGGNTLMEDRRGVTEDEAAHPQSLAARQKDTAVASLFSELRTFLTDIQTLVDGCMGLGYFEPLALVADDVARVLEEFEM